MEDDILPPVEDILEEIEEHDAREYEEIETWFRFRVRPECDNNEVPF